MLCRILEDRYTPPRDGETETEQDPDAGECSDQYCAAMHLCTHGTGNCLILQVNIDCTCCLVAAGGGDVKRNSHVPTGKKPC